MGENSGCVTFRIVRLGSVCADAAQYCPNQATKASAPSQPVRPSTEVGTGAASSLHTSEGQRGHLPSAPEHVHKSSRMAIRFVEKERKSLRYAKVIGDMWLLFHKEEEGKEGRVAHGPGLYAHEPTRGASSSTIRLVTCSQAIGDAITGAIRDAIRCNQ